MGKPLACGACGAAVAGAVKLVDQHLVGTCPGCGEPINMSLAHHAVASADDPQEAEACPKCDAAIGDAHQACPRCGLKREKFADFADSDQGEPPELEALWKAVEENWDDADTHEAYIARAVTEGALPRAGRRYRGADAAGRPGAAEYVERILRMAEATLVATRPTGRRREPFRLTLVVLIGLVFLAGIAAIAVFKRLGETPDEIEERRPPARTHRPGTFPGASPEIDKPSAAGSDAPTPAAPVPRPEATEESEAPQ